MSQKFGDMIFFYFRWSPTVSQYNILPLVYVQNASLEIAWTDVVLKKRSISGDIIAPFFTKNFEGFDINKPEDWIVADHLILNNKIKNIKINKEPYQWFQRKNLKK